jgi:hypothetical protein
MDLCGGYIIDFKYCYHIRILLIFLVNLKAYLIIDIVVDSFEIDTLPVTLHLTFSLDSKLGVNKFIIFSQN